MRHLFFTVFVFSQIINAQNNYPTDYFRSPLDIPLVLAGTFGELRSNHFHSGIDIKTQRREGLNVYSVADGYISRIKIQHFGYGKVIYVTHPNGYTSVYGHLQRFSLAIEDYIKREQYKKQSYEIELFPEPGEMSLKKGEVIAYSGNTGGSGGPHLHFEIRSAGSKPINPLLFGYDIQDSKAPRILGVHAYPVNEGSIVSNSNDRIELRLEDQGNGSFIANKIYASGSLGLGVETYDQLDMAYNKNGPYKFSTSVNGTPHLEYDFESFSFSESRYINTLIDYATYADKRKRIQKCYVEPYNKLSIYNKKNDNGLIHIAEGMSYTIVMEVSDYKGNISRIVVPVEGKKQELLYPKKEEKTGQYLVAARDNIYKAGNASVYFPGDTFYHDLFINIEGKGDTIVVHNDKTPVRKRYTISMDISHHPETDKNQLFIASVSKNGHLSYQHTYRKENTLSTRTRNLGTFAVVKDSVPPTVKPANFRSDQWLSNFRYIKLKIEDDLSGINSYRAKINGVWVLMEYEYKDNSLTYDLSDIDFNDTTYNLELLVTDNVGNSTIFNAVFHKK
ncbi:M23 family metallopeptidase [Galbibacter sp. EGI 63066]|uniref:M23 family metallopeptidase n=1 Tax=Galbibacter sp. EGI 63066 TaxID=2993559 RepID=UPI002248C540|nr:M23 family metallopeptidase [Galbibacter sp. EGI 63066]MCX2678580.1 M23 family metallopeptidase [Galbibacter sp. EGI 63066]